VHPVYVRSFSLAAVLCLPALASIPPQSEGYSALYNLEHDRAIRLFEKETGKSPASADAWNQLAHALLHRRLYLSGAMERRLPAKSDGSVKGMRPEMPADEERRFLEAVRKGMELSEGSLKADSGDQAALYAAGVAHAHLAQYQYMLKHDYVDALKSSNRSDQFHRRLRSVNPQHPDAVLIPGMHEYIAGSVPFYLRWLSSLAGLKGDKGTGLEMVELAARQGRRTAVEARVMLAILYHRERRYGDAAALMKELSVAFPANQVYRRQAEALQSRAANSRQRGK
jgi:hypothetical protein